MASRNRWLRLNKKSPHTRRASSIRACMTSFFEGLSASPWKRAVLFCVTSVGYRPHHHGRASFHPLLVFGLLTGRRLYDELRPGDAHT